jgi:hypothetical protein
MSYCRFENTVNDLQDCYDNWDTADEDLRSDYERRAKKRMRALILQMAEDFRFEDGDDD